jgi:hypothetical protein
MRYFKLAFAAIFALLSGQLQAQTVSLIGTSEENILETITDHGPAQYRALEHEEFDILVFEEKERELSFYFTFYKGGKICSFIRSRAPLISLQQEINFIQENFRKIGDDLWEKPDKSLQVKITVSDGIGLLVAREIRI